MGIILAPLFIGMIVIYFTCFYKVVQWKRNNQIENNNILAGFLLALILYINIYYSYSTAEKVYGLDPFFKIPITSFILPFIVAVVLRFIKKPWSRFLLKSIAISIVITGTLGTIFYPYYFDLLETLNVKTYY